MNLAIGLDDAFYADVFVHRPGIAPICGIARATLGPVVPFSLLICVVTSQARMNNCWGGESWVESCILVQLMVAGKGLKSPMRTSRWSPNPFSR